MPCAAVVRVGIPQTGAGWGGAERVGGGDCGGVAVVTKRSQFAWKWFRVKDLRGGLGSIRGPGRARPGVV